MDVYNLSALIVDNLRDNYKKSGLEGEVFLVGSLETGLYTGPKPKTFSANPNCPYPYVNEIDIRILPINMDLSSHEFDRWLYCLDPSIEIRRTQTVHWDKTEVPMIAAYSYFEDSGQAFEVEICINERPYVDIAPYWKALFNESEIENQRAVRRNLQSSTISFAEYQDFKKLQTFEARWRLVASLAASTLNPGETSFPVKKMPGDPVDSLVAKWLQGQRGHRTLDRLASNRNSIIEPAWVETAEQIQIAIQRNLIRPHLFSVSD